MYNIFFELFKSSELNNQRPGRRFGRQQRGQNREEKVYWQVM